METMMTSQSTMSCELNKFSYLVSSWVWHDIPRMFFMNLKTKNFFVTL